MVYKFFAMNCGSKLDFFFFNTNYKSCLNFYLRMSAHNNRKIVKTENHLQITLLYKKNIKLYH